MKYGNLRIEKNEYELLKRFINLTGNYKDRTLRTSVKKLVGEMECARISDEADMPDDVIRFHTTVTIIAENGWNKKFQLVTPSESDAKNNKISILTPMGTAIIGYAEGDSFVWEFPSGEQKLTIQKVEQNHKGINISL